jgi:hypothetical protein
MPVLVVADVPGITALEDRRVAEQVDYRSQPGFRLRLTGPSENGWRILTLWETLEDFERFRDGPLAEALLEGDLPVPKMEYWQIETVILAQ